MDGVKTSGDVTRLLSAWSSGDLTALNALIPLVYGELHRIAQRYWSGQPQGHTLQPTALIHEAYLKLVTGGETTFQNRAHFFAVASMAMRQILVNHAEASVAKKRGGTQRKLSLDEVDAMVQQEAEQVLALHSALGRLEKMDPRKSRVVELRYFGGLSIEETAQALGISAVTVTRDWQTARAWLAREIGGDAPHAT